MNIIIVGCGKVGQKIAESLSEEKVHNITVIEPKNEIIHDLVNYYDVMGVEGSGINMDTLSEAGIKKTDLLIAVTGSDEVNVLACLLAKKLGNCATIARVRTPEYVKIMNTLKDDLGLTLIINPERAAANEIARILRFPSAIQIDTFAKGRIEILKFKIPADSVLNNLTVGEIVSKLDCDILVCGIERNDEVYIPSGSFKLQSGDLISIIASIKNGTLFFKKIGVKTNRVKDTMIIGGGPTSFYLAQQLIETGINVKIIEQNTEKCDVLCDKLPKASIINGDATDKRVLLEEGIEQAESFVSLTNIDEENILLSMFVKSKSDAKLVTKINRIDYDEVIDKLDLGTTICPKNIAAYYILRFVRAMHNSINSDIETMHIILDGKAEALEFRIKEGSPVANVALEKLKLKSNILIACINRNGNVIIPRGKDKLLPGDTVIIVTLRSGFNDIGDILA